MTERHPVDTTLLELPDGGAGVDPTKSLRAAGVELAATIAAVAAESTSSEAALPEISDLQLIALDEGPRARGDLAVLGLLGEGGMGRVLLGRQRSLRRKVALKTANELPASTRALLHEGVVTGMLEHPNIPPVHALHRDAEGRAVLVMKNVEGVTWAAVLGDPVHPLRSESPLFTGDDTAANLEVLSQVCNALALAHSQGVVHRDVKPENVMLGRFGEVYLIDWGIAYAGRREGSEGRVRLPLVGTAAYMAPEMVRCEAPDERTDVYLLGATLHEVLTGAAPHAADDLRGALAKAFASEPPEYGPEVPHELGELCRRSMAPRREDRPATVREFREGIRSYLAHRASVNLCSVAAAHWRELRALLEAPAADPALAGSLQQECRIGFDLALREWPENPEARAGLADLHRTLAAHELSQGNARGARALLASVPGGDAQLEARIEAAEAAQRAAQEQARKQAEREREMDVRVSQRERTILGGFVAALICGVALRGWFFGAANPSVGDKHHGLLRIWSVLAVCVVGSVLVFHRRLRANEIGRIWRSAVLVILALMGLTRFNGLLFRVPIASTGATELTMFAGAVALLALGRRNRAIWGAAPFLLGAVGAWIWPERTAALFNAAGLAGVLLTTWLWRADSPRAAAQAASTSEAQTNRGGDSRGV